MALTSNVRATLTARAGQARAGASRSAFVPTFVTGLAPGSQGGRYGWKRLTLPTTTWTPVKR